MSGTTRSVLEQGADLIGHTSEFFKKSNASLDTDGARPTRAYIAKLLTDIESALERPPVTLASMPAFVDAIRNMKAGGLDDRKFLLENLLTMMARLPKGHPLGPQVQNFVIDMLYKDLPHPPSGFLTMPVKDGVAPNVALTVDNSEEGTTPPPGPSKYAFRSFDGRDYNPIFPSLGAARSPYARSVPATSTVPRRSLPDAGLVFDSLLKRERSAPSTNGSHEKVNGAHRMSVNSAKPKELFEKHPNGISSLFFAFADLVIHSIFHTDRKDWTQNNTSSYLDLAPLYGNSEQEADQVRRKDGTGRLHNDVFADSRLLLMPPSVSALLVLLNRNHNYIAAKLLDINERGTYMKEFPPNTPKSTILAQDAEIFHRTRLVNSGYFMQIIITDYIGVILGLARDGLDWRLDSMQEMRRSDHEFSPRGEGNAVSIEFNLLYRWHATLSEEDTAWTEGLFEKIFEGKDFGELNHEDFKKAAHKHLVPDPDVKTWTFDKLQRGPDGKFSDEDLANILQNATDWHAGSFRARGTPEVMRVIEVLGIEQGRAWGACSLNEFRKFVGLRPYADFKEWNPEPAINEAAQALYEDIDNLELYVGMQAEEAKGPMAGAGLCPNYTISRAILSDAIALTRGDRFLTTDYTPFNLTAWGYQDVQVDKSDGSFGGMLTKLLFRTLPDQYPIGSSYAHFPFYVPEFIKGSLEKLDNGKALVGKYNWARPIYPTTSVVVVKDFAGAKAVLSDFKRFQAPYDPRVSRVLDEITWDRKLVDSVLFSEAHVQRWKGSLGRLTTKLINEKVMDRAGSTAKYVDIVRDVINIIPVRWIANQVVGLPLKQRDNPTGVFLDHGLYNDFANICNYIFVNLDQGHDWALREASVAAANTFTEYVEAHFARMTGGVLSVTRWTDTVRGFIAGANDKSGEFLQELLDAAESSVSALSHNELAASVVASVVPTAAHFSQAIAHVVDFYLDEAQAIPFAHIVRLCAEEREDDLTNEALMMYVREALRLHPMLSNSVRIANQATNLPDGRTIQARQRVLVSVQEANLDKDVFGSSSTSPVYDSHRDADESGIFGHGAKGMLSGAFFEQTVPAILKVIFRLKGLKRGPGESGTFNSFSQEIRGTKEVLYIDTKGKVTPFAPSLIVQFE